MVNPFNILWPEPALRQVIDYRNLPGFVAIHFAHRIKDLFKNLLISFFSSAIERGHRERTCVGDLAGYCRHSDRMQFAWEMVN
jgi:hypothetical protein